MELGVFTAEVNYPPRLSSRENPEIFYLPHIIKFANFEFIFAIRRPKLATVGGVDFGGTSEGARTPTRGRPRSLGPPTWT